MKNIIIPWPCLIDSKDSTDPKQNPTNKNLTYSNPNGSIATNTKKAQITP